MANRLEIQLMIFDIVHNNKMSQVSLQAFYVFILETHARTQKHTHTHTHTHAHIHTHTVLRPSWILSGTTRVSWHQKGKINLDLLEQEIESVSGISWANLHFDLDTYNNHMSIPASHHSIFYRPGALPAAQQYQSTKGISSH